MRSEADELASLILRTAQKRKNKEKIKTKPSSLEETVQAIAREGSPVGRNEIYGGVDKAA